MICIYVFLSTVEKEVYLSYNDDNLKPTKIGKNRVVNATRFNMNIIHRSGVLDYLHKVSLARNRHKLTQTASLRRNFSMEFHFFVVVNFLNALS